MPRVHVTSEIGALRSVLVHTPGKELVAVTPSTREDYLYDDIIDLELAEREHRRFVAVLEVFFYHQLFRKGLMCSFLPTSSITNSLMQTEK